MALANRARFVLIALMAVAACNRKMSTQEFSNNFSSKPGTNNTNNGASGDGAGSGASSDASSDASSTSGASTTGGTLTTGGMLTTGGTDTTTGGTSTTTGGTDTTTGGTDTTTGGTDTTTGGTDTTTGGDTTGGSTLAPLMCSDGVTKATFPGYSSGTGQCAAHCYLPNDMYNNWFVSPAYCGSDDPIDIPCGAQPGSGGDWSVYYMVTRENICSPRYVGCGHETQGLAVDMCHCNGTCAGTIVGDPDSDFDGHFDPADSHPYNATLWDDWNNNGVNDSEEATGTTTTTGGVSGGTYTLTVNCTGSSPATISGTCNHPGEKVSYSFVNENPSLEGAYPSVICAGDGTFTGLMAPWGGTWGVDHGPYGDPGLARESVSCQ